MTRTPMGSNAAGGTGPFSGQWIEAVGGRFHPTQFEVSQILAERYGITREQQDAFACKSQQKAIKAVDEARTVHGLEISTPYPSSLLIPRSFAIASSLFTSPEGSGTPVLRRCCLVMCSFSPGT